MMDAGDLFVGEPVVRVVIDVIDHHEQCIGGHVLRLLGQLQDLRNCLFKYLCHMPISKAHRWRILIMAGSASARWENRALPSCCRSRIRSATIRPHSPESRISSSTSDAAFALLAY